MKSQLAGLLLSCTLILFLIGCFPKPPTLVTLTPTNSLIAAKTSTETTLITQTMTPTIYEDDLPISPVATFFLTPIPDPCIKRKYPGNGGIEFIEFPKECYGNRIRIDLKTRYTNNGFSLFNISAFGPDDQEKTTDLVKENDTVCVSSLENNNIQHYAPHKVIDRDHTVPTGTVVPDLISRWSSQFHEPEVIVIILSQAQHIKVVQLNWEVAYAYDYKVSVESSDSTECPPDAPIR
jgi:hypothetical protein